MNDRIFDVPFVRGVAVVLPKKSVALETLDFDKDSIKNVMKLSGIYEIRYAAEDETVSDYCLFAANHLFDELNFDKSKIDGVVFATPCPDYISPGSGYIVQDKLNLSEKCVVVDINQACVGYVYGLFQAFLMIQCGYCENVLLCVGDVSTKNLHPKDKAQRMILGDGGSATLISKGDVGFKSAFDFFSDGKNLKSLYIPAGGKRMPRKAGVTDVEFTDDQGNIRTLENNFMNGLDVMSFAMNFAPKNVNNVIENLGWDKDDLDLCVLHQANKFMVKSVGKRLHIPPERIPFVIEKYGNSGSTTIP